MNSAAPTRFADRRDAGRALARLLRDEYAGRDDVVVLALPRGGIPVAFEVAAEIGALLDVFVVRRIPTPGDPELAMGAVATGGIRVLNDELIRSRGITPEAVDAATMQQRTLLAERERTLGASAGGAVDVQGRTVLLLDDGLCTGATARAACEAMRERHPARIVVAIPVASADGVDEALTSADDVICLIMPEPFHSVGWWYDDFSETADGEVRELLARARAGEFANAVDTDEPVRHAVPDRPIAIPCGPDALLGNLLMPQNTRGIVLFAHGSGSGRGSVRNRRVADQLVRAGFAVLLLDLLTTAEQVRDENTRELRFDVRLLTDRLVHALDWVAGNVELRHLPVGLFGGSTGGAAALAAAALRRERVRAVISRGGRSDLAEVALPWLAAATLFVVGEWDEAVIAHNERALALMTAPTRLSVVPGATHLFGEPGALDAVARLSCDWFAERLASQTTVGREATA